MAGVHEYLNRQRKPRLELIFPRSGEVPDPRRQLPFVIAVLADLVADATPGQRGPFAERPLQEVDSDSFGDVLGKLAPRLRLEGSDIPDGGVVELRFRTLEDFAPDRVAEHFPSLRRMLRLRQRLSQLRFLLDEAPQLKGPVADALRDTIHREGVVRATEGFGGAEQATFVRDVAALARSGRLAGLRMQPLPALRHLFLKAPPAATDPDAELERMIRGLDAGLTEAVTPVLHHPRFRALEATWRGLWFLVSHTPWGHGRRITVLDATREEISADVLTGSALFRRFCEEPFELGRNGSPPRDNPASVLLVDGSWGADAAAAQTLTALARLAADCHVVALTNAAPSLVGLGTWDELQAATDLAIGTGEAWRALRDSPHSRHLGLVMPPVAAREPYGCGGRQAEGFAFEEIDGAAPDLSPAWVLAARLAWEDERSGWFVGFRAYQPDGWQPGLSRARRSGGNQYSLMTDRQELAAFRAGLIPLTVSEAGAPFFASGSMVHRPRTYDRPETTMDAAISARLPFVLGTGRFMQSLRAMACEYVAWMEDAQVAERLQAWLHGFHPSAPDVRDGLSRQEALTVAPLLEATLEIRPSPDGATDVVCRLRPWLGREELSGAIRLIARMPRRPSPREAPEPRTTGRGP